MQVPNDLGHTVLLSKAHHQGDGSEVEQLRLKLVPVWEAGIIGGGFYPLCHNADCVLGSHLLGSLPCSKLDN